MCGIRGDTLSDYEKLKALAEAAKNDCGDYVALNDYGMAVPPAVVLELIADLERHKRMLLSAAMDMGAIGNALDADMNSDGEELLSMVVELKAENEALRKDRDTAIKALGINLDEWSKLAGKWEGPKPNTGHGHVFKRADGVRARCGGPRMCKECAIDQARKDAS